MSVTCMGLLRGLSRKFWFGEKIGPPDQYSRKNGPGGPFFPENIGPRLEYWSVLYKLHAAIAVGWQQAQFKCSNV